MAELRLVISDPKTGKSYQKALETQDFEGKKIGDKIDGNLMDLEGYELQITGGSDSAGFPLKKEIDGTGRKKALLSGGTGLKKVERKGIRTRKTVAGNTITTSTVQVNLKVLKAGAKSLEDYFKKEETKEEKPAE